MTDNPSESWHPVPDREDSSLGDEPMLRIAVSALARLCSAPQGWALEAVAQIRDRIRGAPSSRSLREWVPRGFAQLPRIAVPT
eukprot:8758875-Pyramimonas_sp.AAC.1